MLKVNDDSRGTCSDIKFKSSFLKSNLYDYSDAYIHGRATITFQNPGAAAASLNNANKKVIFKNSDWYSNAHVF